MKLFIAGYPGTGKTKLGKHIKSKYGYTHIDLETEEGKKLLAERGNLPNTVITLGFAINDDSYNLIRFLRDNGFKLFWLESVDGSSKSKYYEREVLRIKKNTRPGWSLEKAKAIYETQVENIKKDEQHRRTYPFLNINPFSSFRKFKSYENITNEIEINAGEPL